MSNPLFKFPVRYETVGHQIQNAEGTMIAAVRPWGYITGSGGDTLGSESEAAENYKDQIGIFIAAAMNEQIFRELVMKEATGNITHEEFEVLDKLQKVVSDT